MKEKRTLSLCMIVKDEEVHLGRCLDSVKKHVDEMIIVDTGSNDNTMEIAKSYGAKVYRHQWTDDFSEARNYGIEKATGDWILWMDADEVVDEEEGHQLREVLSLDQEQLASITLINYIGEEPPSEQRAYILQQHRLFRTDIGLRFVGSIHEQLNVKDVLSDSIELKQLPVTIYHYGYLDSYTSEKNKNERNLNMLEKEKEKSEYSPWIDYHIASEYYRMGEYEEAFDAVNESLYQFIEAGQLPPSLLYKLKYETMLMTGSYDGAYPSIDKAIMLYEDYVDLHFYKGVILFQMDMFNEALTTFKHCLELGEENTHHLILKGVGSFHAWYWIGQCYENLDMPFDAASSYQQCLSQDPEHKEATEALQLLEQQQPELTASRSNGDITISLCMIVKDEEESIERVLQSVHDIVDEINIVDTGSADNTKRIVKKFNANIYDYEWHDHFADARNFAFSKATKEYILWLDADDVLLEKDRGLFKQLKKTLPRDIDTVTMPYHLAFDDAGNVTSSLRRNRLVKSSRQFQWMGAVHEYLAVSGKSYHSDVAITHRKNKAYTDRNLKIYRKMQENGEEFSPRERYYFANELRDHGLNEEAIENYKEFLEGKKGWIEDNIQACLKLADCYGKLEINDEQYLSLFKTFQFDQPRADICCEIGRLKINEKLYHQAIYWFKQALALPDPPNRMSMSNPANWTWVPHLQLCVCYDHIGMPEKAYEHNELAKSYNPTHSSILFNEKYFNNAYADWFKPKE
ncbi:glycosyltransferase [Gracilibacillus caseinilyticus]|uniref:Glycosyltransferase n=1 Tax=Gracilibacillus caseinilyticus TaxID=2932256 RepID=A0ABY4EQX9_9BACI|nr:glycosyltransferase [Gracilibacillus caseinilyticus]UOQ46770.1 glycosyltransferase [Gracilibacillus caseinilyticus]